MQSLVVLEVSGASLPVHFSVLLSEIKLVYVSTVFFSEMRHSYQLSSRLSIQMTSWNVEVNLVSQLVQTALVRRWVRILAILLSFLWFPSDPAGKVRDSTSDQTRSAFFRVSFCVIVLLFDCSVGLPTALLSKP